MMVMLMMAHDNDGDNADDGADDDGGNSDDHDDAGDNDVDDDDGAGADDDDKDHDDDDGGNDDDDDNDDNILLLLLLLLLHGAACVSRRALLNSTFPGLQRPRCRALVWLESVTTPEKSKTCTSLHSRFQLLSNSCEFRLSNFYFTTGMNPGNEHLQEPHSVFIPLPCIVADTDTHPKTSRVESSRVII